MILRPPRSTLFPSRRSSDLNLVEGGNEGIAVGQALAGDRVVVELVLPQGIALQDRKSTRLNSSHITISYAVFCLKKKIHNQRTPISISTICKLDYTNTAYYL